MSPVIVIAIVLVLCSHYYRWAGSVVVTEKWPTHFPSAAPPFDRSIRVLIAANFSSISPVSFFPLYSYRATNVFQSRWLIDEKYQLVEFSTYLLILNCKFLYLKEV